MAESAALAITVCPDENRHRGRLLLLEREGRAESFGEIPPQAWLESGRARLADQLYDIRRRLGDSAIAVDPAIGGEALRQIYGLGTRWMHDLLGADRARTRELISFMRSLVPDWGRRSRALRVEIRHSTQGMEIAAAVPFEILPMFDLTALSEVTSKAALTAAAFRFLGMVGVVVHQTRARVPKSFSLRRNPVSGRVPVGAYCDWSLDGVAEEIAIFHELDQDFELEADAIWPPAGLRDSEAAASDLVRRLFGGVRNADYRTQPQIHHFACHFGVTMLNPDDESFSFSPKPNPDGDRGDRIVIPRGMLHQQLMHLAAKQSLDGWRDDGPVAVLNACDSAALHLSEREPLVWWLLDAGYRAVLGTETRIPDLAASRFSRFVYGHLAEGMPLGEAVRTARWDMLEKLNNPVGLFFTLHGRPEVHLTSPELSISATSMQTSTREETT